MFTVYEVYGSALGMELCDRVRCSGETGRVAWSIACSTVRRMPASCIGLLYDLVKWH